MAENWPEIVRGLFRTHGAQVPKHELSHVEVLYEHVIVFFKDRSMEPPWEQLLQGQGQQSVMTAAGRELWGQQPAPVYFHGTNVKSAIAAASYGFTFGMQHSPVGVYSYSSLELCRDSMYDMGAVITFRSYGIVISENMTKTMDMIHPGIIGRTHNQSYLII